MVCTVTDITISGLDPYTTYVCVGLDPYTTYVCVVSAETTIGVGPFSHSSFTVQQKKQVLLKVVIDNFNFTAIFH